MENGKSNVTRVTVSWSLAPQQRPASTVTPPRIARPLHPISAQYGVASMRPETVTLSLGEAKRARPAPRAVTQTMRMSSSVPAPAPPAPVSESANAVAPAVAVPAAAASSVAPPVAPPQPAPEKAPAPAPEPKTPPAPASEPLLVLSGLTKSYGPVRAVDGVSLTLKPGEKHALLGENGAGKSTLVKMIYGVLQPDAGTLEFDGAPARIGSPSEARARGIGMVFQHFSTFEALTVAENLAVVLPDRPLKDIRRDVARIGDEYGLKIEPERRLATLSAGERQRVEIVRCLMQEPRLLIMDEPTSVLTPQEAEALFAVLDRLAAKGCAILYISHRLGDVRRLCDTATVMRRGKVVATCDPRGETPASLAALMIGDAVERPVKQAAFVGKPRLEVADLRLPFGSGMAAEPVTFAARKGEILGIAGVAGEGQSALFAALSGERPTRRPGTVKIDGRPVGRLDPSARRRAGLACAPERRLGHAAIGDMRLSENFRLTHGGLRAARRGATKVREDFDVRAEGRDPFAAALSGGNLQKFVIGREIVGKPAVLVVEQPTWGVDAGAMATIHAALMDLAAQGSAVVVVSQDLDEIFALCDRVAVLHRGTLSEPRVTSTVTAEDLGLLMGGVEPEESEPAVAEAS